MVPIMQYFLRIHWNLIMKGLDPGKQFISVFAGIARRHHEGWLLVSKVNHMMENTLHEYEYYVDINSDTAPAYVIRMVGRARSHAYSFLRINEYWSSAYSSQVKDHRGAIRHQVSGGYRTCLGMAASPASNTGSIDEQPTFHNLSGNG